jgi:hypothetical protein
MWIIYILKIFLDGLKFNFYIKKTYTYVHTYIYMVNSSLDKNDLEMCVKLVQDNNVPNTHIMLLNVPI